MSGNTLVLFNNSTLRPSDFNHNIPEPFRVDRWGNQWDQDGVRLHFGNGEWATSVRLGPQALTTLSSKLTDFIDKYESNFGTIWSENTPALGKRTETRLQWSAHSIADPLAHRLAEKLYLLVKNLPLNGFERSFKLLAGQLWSDRFMVGLNTALLTTPDFEFLANSLAVPPKFLAAMRARLPEASFIHIGFEHGDRHNTYKLYLEFPLTAATTATRTAQTSKHTPMYIGYKWNPENSAQQTVSTYTQPAALELDDVLQKIEAAYGDEHRHVSQGVRDIVTLAASNTGTPALMFVEVTDDNSTRMSFDVNLYESALTVGKLSPILQPLAVNFGISAAVFSRLLLLSKDNFAGHISGGTDREGLAFLTIYHAGHDEVITPS